MLQLAEILQFYPPDFRPSRVEPLGSAGGMSGAKFWRLATSRGLLALRRWPAEHPSRDRLRFIHAVLRHAARKGIGFVPVPITTRSGESFIFQSGHLWELTPWMPGAADYERSPSVEKISAALVALAQFHRATADFHSEPFQDLAAAKDTAVTRHLVRLHAISQNGAKELARAAGNPAWPELEPLAGEFLRALPRAIPRAVEQLEPLRNHSFQQQPCIRDIWHDHVLFTGNEVTALIDFGALDIDTPATDIARLVSSLSDTPLPLREGQGEGSESSSHTLWQTVLAAYSTIRPLSPQETLAARALESSGAILAGCNWLRWINLEARTFEDHAQVLARFRRILARVQLLT